MAASSPSWTPFEHMLLARCFEVVRKVVPTGKAQEIQEYTGMLFHKHSEIYKGQQYCNARKASSAGRHIGPFRSPKNKPPTGWGEGELLARLIMEDAENDNLKDNGQEDFIVGRASRAGPMQTSEGSIFGRLSYTIPPDQVFDSDVYSVEYEEITETSQNYVVQGAKESEYVKYAVAFVHMNHLKNKQLLKEDITIEVISDLKKELKEKRDKIQADKTLPKRVQLNQPPNVDPNGLFTSLPTPVPRRSTVDGSDDSTSAVVQGRDAPNQATTTSAHGTPATSSSDTSSPTSLSASTPLSQTDSIIGAQSTNARKRSRIRTATPSNKSGEDFMLLFERTTKAREENVKVEKEKVDVLKGSMRLLSKLLVDNGLLVGNDNADNVDDVDDVRDIVDDDSS